LKNALTIRRAVAAIALCTIGIHSGAASAQPTRERPSQQRQVRRSASIQWERVPMRDALARVSKLFGEPVFLDRRVDPGLRVSLQLEAASIDEVLKSMADALSLGVSRLGELRYLGPVHAAERLRTIATLRSDEIARLPQHERAQLLRKMRLNWPRLTQPRELVATVASQRGWRVTQSGRIPHDLWAENALPELSLAEQLTVLLVGFDLSFRVMADTRSFDIVPLEPATVQREYRLPRQLADEPGLLQQELPNATARVEGQKLIVEARVEDHERLAEILRGRSAAPRGQRRPQQQSQQVYTLRVQEQPVGAILGQLAERMNWAIEFDEASIQAAGLSLDTRVSFSVENASQDELLDAILAPADLHYRREEDRLIILPRGR
jgi:hypothetical protein